MAGRSQGIVFYCSQESSQSLQILERRQEDILSELSSLKNAVEQMATSLGVSLPRHMAKVSSMYLDLIGLLFI